MSRSIIFCLMIFIVGALTLSSAGADVAASVATLKSCVNNHLPDERKKKEKSKADSLISKCQAEYEALIVDLPPGVRDDARHDIKDQIKGELEKN